jgi:hypothetical protein
MIVRTTYRFGGVPSLTVWEDEGDAVFQLGEETAWLTPHELCELIALLTKFLTSSVTDGTVPTPTQTPKEAHA